MKFLFFEGGFLFFFFFFFSSFSLFLLAFHSTLGSRRLCARPIVLLCHDNLDTIVNEGLGGSPGKSTPSLLINQLPLLRASNERTPRLSFLAISFRAAFVTGNASGKLEVLEEIISRV